MPLLFIMLLLTFPEMYDFRDAWSFAKFLQAANLDSKACESGEKKKVKKVMPLRENILLLEFRLCHNKITMIRTPV